MSTTRMFRGIAVPAALSVAGGILTFGLFIAPVATADVCDNPDPATGACQDNQGGNTVPDPTKYGCPPQDFTCMFNKGMNK